MDDCNSHKFNAFNVFNISSDSSMDDCNLSNRIRGRRLFFVQIPLWTIVTAEQEHGVDAVVRSDSSMDDCNRR